MKTLVSTVTKLLLVDIEKATVAVIESHRREYYGISWFPDNSNLVLSHSAIDNNLLIDLPNYANSEKGYLSIGEKHTSTFLSQPHQLVCAPNGWVIVTNTGRNCISIYNPENGFYKDIRVNDVRWDRLSKGDDSGEHFNSVFLKNNKLYVVAHAFTKGSYILEFSFPDGELINKHLIHKKSGIHNVWVDDANNIFVCDSLSGGLLEVNSDQVCWYTSEAYTRGLAATKDIILVGDSEYAKREVREKSPGNIWVIDRHTMKTLDCIPLGAVGGVHEIRILDCPDEAHHQYPYTNLAWLESIATPCVNEEERQTQRQQNRTSDPTWEENTISSEFECLYNGLSLTKDQWLTPYKNGFSLLIAKQTLTTQYETSVEYCFNNAKSGQHISLVVGYQGYGDSNMLAFLLIYKYGFVHLSLWENKNDQWTLKEKLKRGLKKRGKLSIQRQDNQVVIKPQGRRAIVRHFDESILSGNVGVRTEGISFRNFTVL